MRLSYKQKRVMRIFYIFIFMLIELVSFETTSEFMKRPSSYDRQCLIVNKLNDPAFVKDSEGNQVLVKYKFFCKDANAQFYVKYINEADYYKSKISDIVYIKFEKEYDDSLAFWGTLTTIFTIVSMLIVIGFIIFTVISHIIRVFSDD